jgi:hypothetical protein
MENVRDVLEEISRGLTLDVIVRSPCVSCDWDPVDPCPVNCDEYLLYRERARVVAKLL